MAFGYNANINNAKWEGNPTRVPNLSRIVIVAEANDPSGYAIDPAVTPTTKNNERKAYRTSHPGEAGLYLFGDFHVESLQGDRGYSYYTTHPNETNIWKWW